ncbi:hypothetical protein CBL_20036, partial [Carabus blaptoides fortunei]
MNEILQIEGQQPGPPLMVNPNINPKNELQLFNMLSEYEDTLQEPEPSDDLIMKIKLSEEKTIVHRPRRLSIDEQQKVKKIVKDLQQKGVVRHSRSEYCSPI